VSPGAVRSAVWLAGPAPPKRLGGVDVIHGLEAAKVWRAALVRGTAEHHVDADAVRRLWNALDNQVRVRDERAHALTPPLPTLSRVYWTALGVVVLGLLSFLLSLEAWEVFHPWWAWSISIVVLACVGLAARRARSLGLLTTAWLTGVAAAVLLVAGLAIGLP